MTYRQAATMMWQCSTIACDSWFPETTSKCKACGKHRLKDKNQQKPEIDYFSYNKGGKEVIGRLCPQEDGEDVTMDSTDYTLPAEQVELVQRRAELKEQLDMMISNRVHPDAVKFVQEQLDGLPMPTVNQPVRDWACLTAQQLTINNTYRKQIDICNKTKVDLEQEILDRAAKLTKSIEEANQDFAARIAAIQGQHAIHLADTVARQETNNVKTMLVEEQHNKKKEELTIAIAAASKREAKESAAPSAAQPPRPPPPRPPQPANVTPSFSAETIMAQMATSGLVAGPPEHAAALAAMIAAMLTKAMAPQVVPEALAITLSDAEADVASREKDEQELSIEAASLNGERNPVKGIVEIKGKTPRVGRSRSPRQ
jgi:hypothetical protein